MQKNYRNFIIVSKHKRLTRLWQFLFTGWGLVMIAALVAGSFFTNQILWTPIKTVNMKDMVSNQFKMTNATFVGTDKDGNPFNIHAKSGNQKYNNPYVVFLDKPSGTITRKTDKGTTTDKITASNAQFNHKTKIVTFTGNVHVDSSNGDKMLTDELVVKL